VDGELWNVPAALGRRLGGQPHWQRVEQDAHATIFLERQIVGNLGQQRDGLAHHGLGAFHQMIVQTAHFGLPRLLERPTLGRERATGTLDKGKCSFVVEFVLLVYKMAKLVYLIIVIFIHPFVTVRL
jgi:hypothetical protein